MEIPILNGGRIVRVYKSLVFVFSAVVMSITMVDSSMAAWECEYSFNCIRQAPQQLEIYNVDTDEKVGKIIVIQPGGGKSLINTLILEDAIPSTLYTVGFSVIGTGPVPPNQFSSYLIGTFEVEPGLDAGLYIDGEVTTNPKGRASYLMDLKGLPSGDWALIFWVSPCLSDGPCPSEPEPEPQAATGNFYDIETVTLISVPE